MAAVFHDRRRHSVRCKPINTRWNSTSIPGFDFSWNGTDVSLASKKRTHTHTHTELPFLFLLDRIRFTTRRLFRTRGQRRMERRWIRSLGYLNSPRKRYNWTRGSIVEEEYVDTEPERARKRERDSRRSPCKPVVRAKRRISRT